MCRQMFFSKFGKFFPIVSSNIIFAPSFLPFFLFPHLPFSIGLRDSYYVYVGILDYVPYLIMSLVLLIFFSLFFFVFFFLD